LCSFHCESVESSLKALPHTFFPAETCCNERKETTRSEESFTWLREIERQCMCARVCVYICLYLSAFRQLQWVDGFIQSNHRVGCKKCVFYCMCVGAQYECMFVECFLYVLLKCSCRRHTLAQHFLCIPGP